MTTRVRPAALVQEGHTLLEGPRWHDGRLWVSDFFTRRVLRFDVDGPRAMRTDTVCVVPGRPSGLGFMPDGALRISSMDDCRLLEWSGGRLDEVASYGDKVTGPSNDLAIDRVGTAIIGNFGVDPGAPLVAHRTSLIRVTAGGDVAAVADDVIFPNGIVIDDAAGLLYVAETYRSRITVFDYRAGALSAPRIWHAFDPDPHDGGAGPYDILAITEAIAMVPDGIAIDVDGGMWVANAIGHAVRVGPDGAITDRVDTREYATYAVALGGADGRDLYLCCAPPAESYDPSTATRSALFHARADVAAPV